MKITETISKIQKMFSSSVSSEVATKQDNVGGILNSPVFQEIPPDSKAGQMLTEGVRSWSYIAMSAIADEISTNPLKLIRENNEGYSDVFRHPAMQLLQKPNKFQTKEEFIWLLVIYWLAEGEAPIYFNKKNNPTEMILLNPDRLIIKYDEKDIIGGYRYKNSKGKEINLDADNVIMLKLPNFQTPFRGTGVIKYIANTLDVDKYIWEYVNLFFYNNTAPGGVLETEQRLTDIIIKRLVSQFRKRHQGIKNSHKLAVLEGGLKFKQTSSGINDLQIKEITDLIRDKVLATFKVPKSILGIVEDVNRANSQTSEYTFSKRAILPKIRMIEGQLNDFYLPKFSGTENLKFVFEMPVFDDALQKAQIYEISIRNGWMTVDEVRKELGMEKLKENEETQDTEETQEQEETSETGETEDNKKATQATQATQATRATQERSKSLTDIMKDFIEQDLIPKKEWKENELEQFHKDKILFLDLEEKEMKEKLNKNFERQGRELISQLNKKSNELNVNLDIDTEIEKIIGIASPYIKTVIRQEADLAYQLLGIQGSISDFQEEVNTFIQERTLKLGKTVTETTQKKVDNIIKNWSEKEGSITELKKELKNYFNAEGEENARWRAELIARTELSKASGFAQEKVYKETGAIGKQWLTARDERVCYLCSSMNVKFGEGITVGINQNFFDKGDTFPDGTKNTYDSIGTPPLHPACRCDIIPVYGEVKDFTPNKDEYQKVFNERRKEILQRKRTEKKLKLVEKKEESLRNLQKDLENKFEDLNKQNELKWKELKEKENQIKEKDEEITKELKKIKKYNKS